MNPNEKRSAPGGKRALGEEIIQKLNYLAPALFVVVGLGVISGLLFSGGSLGRYRVVFGAIIMIYGMVRLWSVKKREGRER